MLSLERLEPPAFFSVFGKMVNAPQDAGMFMVVASTVCFPGFVSQIKTVCLSVCLSVFLHKIHKDFTAHKLKTALVIIRAPSAAGSARVPV